MLASWPGAMSAGRVNKDLIDFTDFFPTFAELAGAKLPEKVAIDGHSFAPQLRGQPGRPREWVFVQLGLKWYVCDGAFKLSQAGELFDMKDAPFVEQPVPADSSDASAQAARKRLQAVLDQLKPASGKTDVRRAGPDGKKDRMKENRRRKREKPSATPA